MTRKTVLGKERRVNDLLLDLTGRLGYGTPGFRIQSMPPRRGTRFYVVREVKDRGGETDLFEGELEDVALWLDVYALALETIEPYVGSHR